MARSIGSTIRCVLNCRFRVECDTENTATRLAQTRSLVLGPEVCSMRTLKRPMDGTFIAWLL